MELVIRDNKPYLVQKDEQYLHIQEMIEAKRKMLLEKQKKLRFISKQNLFLEEVKNDYKKYNSYIIDQKQQQIKALDLLNNYINDLTVSGNLTKHNIEDAKEEQKKIIHEMKIIKGNLDSMMEDTDIIRKTLRDKNVIV